MAAGTLVEPSDQLPALFRSHSATGISTRATMASQQALKKRLKALMNRPENQVCSDCPEKQPRWASLIVPPPGSPPGSLPIGAFCCLECSGSHRRLGVHISFVRSVNLDQWKEREVLAMENGGNKKVNAIFEAKLGPYSDTHKPSTGASGPERERFIRDKYERRKYYDPSVLQRFSRDESSEEESESDDDYPKGASGKSKATSVVRAPSDAARKRAETRKARLSTNRPPTGTAQSSGPKSKVIAPKKQSKPAPAPAPLVDLLDFSTPAPAPAQPTEPPPPPPSGAPSPQLDLFANMTISNGDAQTAPAAPTPPISENRKKGNDEILAMFSSPAPQQSQQAFGDFSAFNGMGTGGSNTGTMSGTNNAGNGGGMAMVNTPNNGMMMMGSNPGVANMFAQQQAQNMMMMQQNGMGNTTMMMQHRSDSGNLNTMTMQQQGKPVGGNTMGQNGMPGGFSGLPMGGNAVMGGMGGNVGGMGNAMGGMAGMGMGMGMGIGSGMGMPPMSPQSAGNQVFMGGLSPASAAVTHMMGGQPMGGQAYTGQPMGGQASGNNQANPKVDKFSEFSPW